MSRVVWDCSLKIKIIGDRPHQKLNKRKETDREKVLRRKGEKDFEERVK